MKRVMSTVCITALVLICLVVAFAPLTTTTASAQESAWNAYDYYHYFAVNYKDRTVGSSGELAAANWLCGQLTDMGYTANVVPFTITLSQMDSNGDARVEEVTSYNVVAGKAGTAGNGRTLLLAANYGNEYALGALLRETLQWEDACRNGTAVGTLLAIARDLSKAQLSFDVSICFWGADCGGTALTSQYNNRGAEEFIKRNESKVDKLLGYIQLDAVGCGDNLNVYYDEVKRTHAEYTDALIKRNGWNVGTKPFDPGYMYSVQGSLQYSHPGLQGANALFMEKGVPSMYLFGYNWVGGTKNSESATKPDILYTTKDNVENYESLYGKDAIQSRLEVTRKLVVTLVTGTDFEAKWTAAKDDAGYWGLNTRSTALGIGLAVGAVAVIVCIVMCVLYSKKAKAVGKPDFGVGSSFINGQADTSEDIFDGSTPVRGEEGAVDDGNADNGNSSAASANDDDIFGEY